MVFNKVYLNAAKTEALLLASLRKLVSNTPSGIYVDGAHVEFMKGIANPIGLKCGPSTDPDELLKLVETLNPSNSFGRLTLIARMGASQIREKLSPLVKAIKKSGLAVGWCCDPMHGNTIKASNGYKTRKVDDIMEEVKGFFEVQT